MDQTRYFLAIGLTFIVLMGWQYFFVAPNQNQLPLKNTVDANDTKNDMNAEDNLSVKNSDEKPKVQAKALVINKTTEPQEVADNVDIETNLYKVVLSEKNAAITKFVLKDYKEKAEKDSPLKEIVDEKTPGFLDVSFLKYNIKGLENAVFSSDKKEIKLTSDDEKNNNTVTMQWSSEDGVDIIKTYTFNPDTYLFDMKLIVNNRSEKDLNDSLAVNIYETVEKNTNRYGFIGPAAYVDDTLNQIKMDDIDEGKVLAGNVGWNSVQDIYFMKALIPEKKEGGKIKITRENGIVTSSYIRDVNVSAGAMETFNFNQYFGPKESKILSNNGHNLDKSLNFGWFDFIAKPCLWFMNFIYSFIPNYGVAIIILTLIIKLVLWPLGTKSYKSMGQMKKIQPLMAEIREKYKDDKKRMNEEMMSLYKTYKVNPVGGCLPMFLQIPVFFALYRMLYEAIELRHAPFFGWINDLSAPDRLFRFDFSIPFMHEPYGIPVLTLVMGATMILQQKMSPPPGDPGQAKMMMLMPVVFTFIFINFSSGLVLYWLINNIVSIGQQYYITKKTT